MTKPRDSRPKLKAKAPGAAKPVAPSARVEKEPIAARRREGRGSGRSPYSKTEERAPIEARGPQKRAAEAAPRKAAEKPVRPAAPESGEGPAGAQVSRRAADRLRAGYLWVYASDIEALTLPKGDVPSLLPVADGRGLLLGTALYSPASQIALRMIAREAVDEAGWLAVLEERLRRAIARRRPLLDAENDACRLCFSEADELPGVVADKYAGLVILQLLTKGLDTQAVRAACVRVLREELKPEAILERPDPRMRELEGLAAPGIEPLYVRDGAQFSASTLFHLSGLKFHYDANSGQKTGAFLDQQENYAAARAWAERLGATGRALDVCCYQGGFALHLAEVCEAVTGIDASRASLEVAERNLEANRARLKAGVEWVEADAFQIMRDLSDGGERYDTIVLDPPAFAKTRRAVEGALRGYKELNLRALKMMGAGGLLVTCSCSHHVGWSELEGVVAAAAADAGRRVRLLERRGAAQDHPVVLNLPETEYLKCLVLEVE